MSTEGDSSAEPSSGGSPRFTGPSGIGRNFALGLVQQITTAFFTAGLTLYLVRALGPKGYGAFTLALGVGGLAQLLAEFGIPQSLARFVAENRANRSVVTELLAEGLRLQLLTAALCTSTLAALAGPIAAAYDNPDLVWPLRGMALAMFGQSVLSMYLNAFVALARVGFSARVVFVESLTEAAASIALVAFGAGVVGATVGRAIGYLFGALLAGAVVARLFGRRSVLLRRSRKRPSARIAGYATPLLITNSAYTLYDKADVLIIGGILGTASVGLFGAPLRMVSPLGYFGQAVANSVAPRQLGSERGTGDASAFGSSVRWLVIGHAVVLAPLIVWATPIVDLLLGAKFSESANVLRCLAPYVFLLGVSPLITTTVNYVGGARRRIRIVLGALSINIAIDLLLIPRIGVVAGAIGTTVAYCFYVPGHIRLLPPELRAALRPLPATLLRALLAAALMAAVMYATGTRDLSLRDWLTGGVAGVAVFGAVLLLTREISVAEMQHGRRAVLARLSVKR